MGNSTTYCDFAFPVRGKVIPYEHGYPLYSALSGICPPIHEDKTAGIFQIPSNSMGDGKGILKKNATLKIRGPASFYPELVGFAGSKIELGGHPIHLGVPAAHPLQPAGRLEASLVVIKGYMEEEAFGEAVNRQLKQLSVECNIRVGSRNVVRIKGKNIVGFGVELQQLDPDAALKIMRNGVGGRRKMGCGLFEPRKEE